MKQVTDDRTLDSVEREIKNRLSAFVLDAAERKLESDRDWTIGIKTAIAAIGLEQGHSVCATGIDHDNLSDAMISRLSTEWLYDLIWYDADVAGHVAEVPLVLESEWGASTDAIFYDFDKLLLAKSKYKVMIFQGLKGNLETHLKTMDRLIDSFHPRSVTERYLLVCYDWDTGDFEFHHKVTT